MLFVKECAREKSGDRTCQWKTLLDVDWKKSWTQLLWT